MAGISGRTKGSISSIHIQHVATRDLAFGGVPVPAAQVQAAFLAAFNGAFANVQMADEIGV